MTMLLNYLNLAYRILLRKPFLGFVNIFGLSIGFASFFILWNHATSGLTSDSYHPDADRSFRLGAVWHYFEEGISGNVTMAYIRSYQIALIREDFPEIKDHTWLVNQTYFLYNEETLGYSKELQMAKPTSDDQQLIFKETNAVVAATNLFEYFTIPLIQGSPQDVLRQPNTVALSEDVAARYFGKENPMGKTLLVNQTKLVTVTGVFENLSKKSTHLDFDIIFSGAAAQAKLNEPLENKPWIQCYVKLNDGASSEDVVKRINQRMEKYWGLYFQFYGRAKAEYYLQPLPEVVFSNYYWGDEFQPKSKLILTTLRFVSVLIIVMAWVNYVNLSIARILKRTKEIAARKIAGAVSIDLIWQHITESVFVNVLAVLVALTWMQLVRQPLNEFFQIQLPAFDEITISTWAPMVMVASVGVLITSLYPAYLAVTHSPRRLLVADGGPATRSSISFWLVSLQHAGACALMVFGFIVFLQLSLILNKDLGFNKARVLIIEAPATTSPRFEKDFHFLLTEIRKRYEATYSHSVPGDARQGEFRLMRPGQQFNKGASSSGCVDESFIPFFGLKLLAGRNFTANDRSDVCIISRISVERLGFKSVTEAIGSRVLVDDGLNKEFGGIVVEMEVIGVTEDFRINPFFNYGDDLTLDVEGSCLTFGQGPFNHMPPLRIAIRLVDDDIPAALASIAASFRGVFPGSALTSYFLDDHVNKVYDREKITRNQIALFTLVAIGISCLGLVSMISNRVEKKTKELGIRKVLGAGLPHLTNVLLRDTIQQLSISVLLGLAISYYVGHLYLSKYSERIDLEWWHFLFPVALLLLIMFVTISSTLVRAVASNPVEALKHE